MFQTLASLLIVLLGAVLILRRADVRLVLALSAAALFALAGRLPEMFDKMAKEMAKPDTIVPICSAIGFAYVLKLTECDKHLVTLLLRPLRYPSARFLLIPGGIAVSYLVNVAIVSQTGVAAVVGPILIPLLLANGVSPVTAGALLLLGSSMGGELFNPGAVEIVTLAGLTNRSPVSLSGSTAAINLTACGVALLVFWYRARRAAGANGENASPSGREQKDSRPPPEPVRLNLAKAIVPTIPLVLLVLAQIYHTRLPKEFTGYVTILVAMLIGVTAAAFTSPHLAGKLSGAFFEGAGYAYTHVISLIVTGTIFTEGIKANGLIEKGVALLAGQPALAILTAIVLPWVLAVACGSGIAPAVAVMKALLPHAAALNLDPVQLGTLTAMGAHYGRTMSPVAAVAAMCVTLVRPEDSRITTFDLVKRVAVPLYAGGLVLLLSGLVRLLTR